MRLTRKRIVYVLGAGPAGLLAATAAEERGCEVLVFTRGGPGGQPAKSELYGCQYLHAPVPTDSIAGNPDRVRYLLDGTAAGYREKVYGERWQGQVSPDEYGPEENHMAWDLRAVYDELWEKWHYRMAVAELNAPLVQELLDKGKPYRMLSTVPAPALCGDDEHNFLAQQVWAFGEAPGRVSPVPCPPFTVVCNGDRDTGWYRVANVYGHTTVEWPGTRRQPPIEGVVKVQKPLRTDCECWIHNPAFRRLGRYGRWQKGVLVHTAYYDALEMTR